MISVRAIIHRCVSRKKKKKIKDRLRRTETISFPNSLVLNVVNKHRAFFPGHEPASCTCLFILWMIQLLELPNWSNCSRLIFFYNTSSVYWCFCTLIPQDRYKCLPTPECLLRGNNVGWHDSVFHLWNPSGLV
jgi:hypothetical protein